MKVVIEYVLIDNFVIDYLLLSSAYFTCGVSAKRRRIFFSALFGGVFALIFPLLNFHPVLLSVIKICTGFLLVAISYNFLSFRNYVVVSTVFIAYTFALGGGILGLYYIFGLSIGTETCVATVILPAYACLKALRYVVRHIYRRKDVACFTYPVELSFGEKIICGKGFLDTGNGVYDGENPVVIINKGLAKEFIGASMPKIKRIHVDTVNGGEEKVAFCIDGIKIFGENFDYASTNVTLCVSKTGFETDYEIILHPALFDFKFAERKSGQDLHKRYKFGKS